ncbi:hypothetical protein PHMEG_00020985, partial [Phytophthora megakarya]
GFWQLPLAEESQEVLSFMTDEAVNTPTRVPQVAIDSALYFQSQMQRVLVELIPHNAQVWIDDVLIYAKTGGEFIDEIRRFFLLLHRHNLKLNLMKSCLFQREVTWCGRVISGDGVRHDPARISALTELPLPKTAAELQYFVCAYNWLRDAIIDFSRVFAPLLTKLDIEKKRVSHRSLNALNVDITWTEMEQKAFEAAIESFKPSALMTFPTEEGGLCVFTDASMSSYSMVVTMVRAWDLARPVEEQDHSFVICKGAMFHDSQLSWLIIEKEVFPIIKACSELQYLLLRRKDFRLYCDHANLIYLFSPSTEVKKHSRPVARPMLPLRTYHTCDSCLMLHLPFRLFRTLWKRRGRPLLASSVTSTLLWSRIDQRLPNNKLIGQWLGLFRIIKAMPHAFNIQHLVTNKVYEVHGTRPKFYADADLDMNVEMQELVTSQGIVLDVAAFVKHRYNALLGRWEHLAQWAGLQSIEKSWESFEVMQKDVPKLC